MTTMSIGCCVFIYYTVSSCQASWVANDNLFHSADYSNFATGPNHMQCYVTIDLQC